MPPFRRSGSWILIREQQISQLIMLTKMDLEDPDKLDADTVIELLVTVRSLPDQRRVEFLLM